MLEKVDRSVLVREYGLDKDYTISDQLHDAMMSAPDFMLVERPPQQGNDVKLSTIYGELMAWAGERGFLIENGTLIVAYPGAWKPWADSMGLHIPSELNGSNDLRHCRDSFMMGVWYLARNHNLKPRLNEKKPGKRKERSWS